jgi:hypothetical protein
MKHNDGYTEHIEVHCSVCAMILMTCICELKEPKRIILGECNQHERT